MGFGTLFIGYFFLVNISYFAYTDILAATVMLLGLYRLGGINRGFKIGLGFAAVFSFFSLFELVTAVLETFVGTPFLRSVSANIAAPRYVIIFALTLAILFGIHDVAREVDAKELAARAAVSIPFSSVFAIYAILEISAIAELLGKIAPFVYFAFILAGLVYVLSNLFIIYNAYRLICMPGDEDGGHKRKAEGWFSKFEKYEEAKSREYAEYKITRDIEKKRKRAEKKNNKGK